MLKENEILIQCAIFPGSLMFYFFSTLLIHQRLTGQSLVLGKALMMRFTLMGCYLVDIRWLTEAFEGDKISKFDVNSTDGATIFAYLGKGGKI